MLDIVKHWRNCSKHLLELEIVIILNIQNISFKFDDAGMFIANWLITSYY